MLIIIRHRRRNIPEPKQSLFTFSLFGMRTRWNIFYFNSSEKILSNFSEDRSISVDWLENQRSFFQKMSVGGKRSNGQQPLHRSVFT